MISGESMNFGMFLTAAIVLAIVPGPGILYVMARTLAGGKRDGIASAFGTAVGGLVHVVIAALGLSALLAASAEAFTAVKYVGAAYLVFLGIRTVVSASSAPSLTLTEAPHMSIRRAFIEGAVTEALNVKTALFFLAFIPQFINHQIPAAPQFVLLGLICTALNTSVDLFVVLLATRMLPYLAASPKPARLMSYGSGAVLVGLGAYVALAETKR